MAYLDTPADQHAYREPMTSIVGARCRTCGLPRALCEKAQVKPQGARMPDEQTIEERATFLAREIYHDLMTQPDELAEAISREIRRFLK